MTCCVGNILITWSEISFVNVGLNVFCLEWFLCVMFLLSSLAAPGELVQVQLSHSARYLLTTQTYFSENISWGIIMHKIYTHILVRTQENDLDCMKLSSCDKVSKLASKKLSEDMRCNLRLIAFNSKKIFQRSLFLPDSVMGKPVIEEVYYLQNYAEGWTDGKWEERMDRRPCVEESYRHPVSSARNLKLQALWVSLGNPNPEKLHTRVQRSLQFWMWGHFSSDILHFLSNKMHVEGYYVLFPFKECLLKVLWKPILKKILVERQLSLQSL